MEIGRQRDPRNRRSKTLPSSATVPPPLPFSSFCSPSPSFSSSSFAPFVRESLGRARSRARHTRSRFRWRLPFDRKSSISKSLAKEGSRGQLCRTSCSFSAGLCPLVTKPSPLYEIAASPRVATNRTAILSFGRVPFCNPRVLLISCRIQSRQRWLV